jgi:integrase
MTLIKRAASERKPYLTFGVQIEYKDALTGKVKTKNNTWDNPERLAGVRAERAATVWGENWEREFKANLSRAAAFKHPRSTAPFCDVARKYLEIHKPTLAKSTYYRYADTIEGKRGLNNYFGQMPLENIKAVDVQNYFAMLNNGKYTEMGVTRGYAHNTIKKYKITLCMILNWAVRMEIIPTNYAGGNYMKGKVQGERREKKKVLTDDEVGKILAVLEKTEIRRALPLWCLMKLGITVCEFAGLDWDAVDLEKAVLRIKQDRVPIPKLGIVEGDTKNEHRVRNLPLDKKLVEKFTEAKALYETHRRYCAENGYPFDDCGAVFYNFDMQKCGKKDGSPANPRFVNNLLREILVKALGAAAERRVSPHRLRAGFITKLVRQGVTPEKIVPIVGHADMTMIMEIYTEYCHDMSELKTAMSLGY